MRCLSMGNAQIIIASDSQTASSNNHSGSSNPTTASNSNNYNSNENNTITNTKSAQNAQTNMERSEYTQQTASHSSSYRSSSKSNSLNLAKSSRANRAELKDCINESSVISGSKENLEQLPLEHNFFQQDSDSYKEASVKASLSSSAQLTYANSSDTSCDSEEIDLTSNTGCIDYSNSNGSKH
uniref:Uncharacterized protein n=1 Tax=Anopheles dirus TaxID=7168 RepID=A0A182NY81_9DIPT